ncbi:hypothetical protein SDC9_158993 [bioreactor metagenome]|uniref:Uncharacterized protein n=1 Tax=bioreactor metagenome TaxID=1076179 RepID=A0A645FDL7_9ZZZZ
MRHKQDVRTACKATNAYGISSFIRIGILEGNNEKNRRAEADGTGAAAFNFSSRIILGNHEIGYASIK